MASETIPSHLFGTYTLVRKLGEGGMAEVYLGLAVDPSGELVPAAIKIAKNVSGIGVDVDELFANEADLMALLKNQGVVRLFEVGKAGSRFFIAMEHLSGGDLAGVLAALKRRGRTFPPSMAVALTLKVLATLAFVHTAKGRAGTPLGLIHGDVNPGNIFFDAENGRIKLGDFGVAVSQTMGVGLPEGLAGGKLNYLSPEQAGGLPVTPATDVFAMATVLYELLYGIRPFEGGEAEEVLARITQRKFNSKVDLTGWKGDFFAKAFARKERDRFATAGAMAAFLTQVQLDEYVLPSDEEVCRFLNGALDGKDEA